MRLVAVLYGVLCYAFFLGVFLYAIGFVGNLLVPTSVDVGRESPLAGAITVDVILLGIFAFQHSIMARPAFKRWWTRFIPTPVERSTYVLFASSALALLLWQWRPITSVVWSVDGAPAVILQVIFWAGWALVLFSTFLINHFELFGLRQVWQNFTRARHADPAFRTPLLYRIVRHPLYLGFIMAFWAAPVMTAGHLLFAAATTAYIIIAIQFEERDLISVFGQTYADYRKRVSMLIPWPRRNKPSAPARPVTQPRSPTH